MDVEYISIPLTSFSASIYPSLFEFICTFTFQSVLCNEAHNLVMYYIKIY